MNEQLTDFDAVSLYPSVISCLYCVKDKQEIITDNELNIDYLLNHTCWESEQPSQNKSISSYVVEIQIIKINKYLNFHCVVYKNKKTNTNKNNDLDEVLNKITVVDNITLEYWIKHQGLECEIIRSYKLCGEKSFLIHDVIKKTS